MDALELITGVVNFPNEEDTDALKKLLDVGQLCIRPGFPNWARVISLRPDGDRLNHSPWYVADREVKEYYENYYKRLHETKKSITGTEFHNPPEIFTPDCREFKRVFRKIHEQKALLLQTLETCRSTGKLDSTLVAQAFYSAQRNACLAISLSGFDFEISLNSLPHGYATIEDELETKLYLYPLLGGYAKKLVNTKYCDECGKIFIYRSSKATFCSDKCRAIAGRKRRSEL